MIEKQILGSVLVDPECMNEIADFVQREWFTPPYDDIWGIMSDLYTENIPIDSVSIYEQSLKRKIEVNPSFISKLASDISSGANVQYYATVLAETWKKKELLKQIDLTKGKIEEGEDIFEITEDHLQKVMDISVLKNDRETSISDSVTKVLKHIDLIYAGETDSMWVQSGFYDLDDKFKFGNTDLIYIAARPSMGKTSLMLSLAKNIGEHSSVGIFSLEMSSEQLTTRLISGESGIPYLTLLSGHAKKEDASRISNSASKISGLNIFIDDSGGLSPMALITKARRMKKKYDIKILFVDYIGLMRYDKLNSNKNAELSYISARLKELAKDLNIPVVVLSQLSRGVELRSNKQPILSDLRDSGSLEQDADSVIMLYRPEYYGDSTLDNGDSSEGVCQLLIRKQRNGGVGEVNLHFAKETTTFQDLLR